MFAITTEQKKYSKGKNLHIFFTIHGL